MTKKGYQKRLPTVLVPAPRPAPESERLPDPEPGRVPEPEPEQEPEPGSDRPAAPPPVSSVGKLVAAGAVGAIVVLVVGIRLVSMLGGDDPSASGPAAAYGTRPPVPVEAGESYVDLRVVANGDVEVTQWVAAAEPLDRVRLDLPPQDGAPDLEASVVVVLADGVLVAGPNRITGPGATYRLDSATDVQISYRLTGAVQLSDSVTGRALAATGLDVAFEPRSVRETRVVHAPGLLSLACGSIASGRVVPCGEETGSDEWTVDLEGPETTDRVVAQLTLE